MARKANIWNKTDDKCGELWSDSSSPCEAPLHWCMQEGNHRCKCKSCGVKKR